jgi:predicted nucleic acid-binding protein
MSQEGKPTSQEGQSTSQERQPMSEEEQSTSQEFVLDSSVTLSWYFDDELTPATDALLDQLNNSGRAVVAGHWALEICNTLVMAERRKRSTVADSSHFLDILAALPIETDQETAAKATTVTLSLARTHGLTIYDSAYLELAMRNGLPLATLDKQLREAAKKIGVLCLPKDL